MLTAPATACKVDATALAEACARLEAHLTTVPEGKYARRDWSSRIGLIALRLLILLAALLALLIWRGLL